jgi:formate dehydrogenase maturation protein FdhE
LLHYIAAEGEGEKYRVDLCDHCHGYLKSVTAFAPTPPELLTIEDAALLHLDEAARERGYTSTPEVRED